MPEVGLEPTWALSPLDFESSAYTNFATPARTLDIKTAELPASNASVNFTGKIYLTVKDEFICSSFTVRFFSEHKALFIRRSQMIRCLRCRLFSEHHRQEPSGQHRPLRLFWLICCPSFRRHRLSYRR